MKIILVALSFLIVIGACSSNQKKIYIIRGDDVGSYVFRDFLDEYNKTHKQVEFIYNGAGSQTAVNTFLDNTSPLFFSLKKFNNEDLILFKSKNIYINTIPLVKVPLVVVVNADLPVDDIDLKQVKNIFSGYFRYWWQVFKKNKAIYNNYGPIEFCSLDRRNGEYYFFKEVLNLSDFFLDTKYFKHNSALIDFVEQNNSAIGYVSLPFYDKGEKVKIIYSKEDIEATGFLVINNELENNPDIKDFVYQLKSFLYNEKNQLNLLQKGIKVIKQ
jgi:ABC-type phosphate transport system substrate-binding protein